MLFMTMVIMFALSTIYRVMFVVVSSLVRAWWFSEFDRATHSPPNWLPMFCAVPFFSWMSVDGHAKIPVLLVVV
jgi:hypothetical protein